MLVESGLALALESSRIRVGGGVWTPAICQVNTLYPIPNILCYASR